MQDLTGRTQDANIKIRKIK